MAWLNWLLPAYVAALLAETGMRLWLATRQLTAVNSHRDEVPAAFRGQIAPADQRKAADYGAARVRLSRCSTVAECALKLWLTVGGGLGLVAATLDATLPGTLHADSLRGCLVILCIALLLWLLDLPFSIWRTFQIEARFGFNRVTPLLFAVDALKGLGLALVLGAPLLLLILVLMQRAGDAWWVWAWGAYVIAIVVLTWAAPRFIAPLFNRFTALADPVLRGRVESLLERCGFSARGGVFVMDGSRRSAHGNAYFTGFGRNKRIVFFDTLLARIDAAEIEAVLAHELGHFRLNHVRQRLALSLVTALAGFALLGLLSREPGFYHAFGVNAAPHMALLLFVITVPAFTYFATPLMALWSRRQEAAADEFAVRHADARALMSALAKLYRDNATTLTPDALHSAFYDSHPSAVERIARLGRLAAGEASG